MKRGAQFKEIGRMGGLKVASLYGEEFFQERSSKGGQACLRRYGREFYRAIRLKRESQGK